ncbi:MAG: D-2-hydroxyacid dehydrogenase [Bacillota bacterium]|nr:D-2-hydroxyacid dehydrogenase [Bacillota bacterium]
MEAVCINRILVTGRLYKELEKALTGRTEKEFLFLPEDKVNVEALDWADAYVAFRPVENFNFYNLKWIHALGAGVDSFLFNRAWKKDVVLTRTICSFGTKISEYCLSYILSDLQKQETFESQQCLQKWQQHEPKQLKAQKILIIGTGVIGQEVAKNLSLLGVQPLGVSLSGEKKQYFNKIFKFDEISTMLSEIDWIINTLPLTEATEGIIGKNLLGGLSNACFINVGRGKSVDEKALLQALDSGRLRKAVLDVFAVEPLPEDSSLWRHPNIIITPHISAITSVEEGVECFLDTLRGMEQGCNSLPNLVDTKRGY